MGLDISAYRHLTLITTTIDWDNDSIHLYAFPKAFTYAADGGAVKFH